MYLFFCRKKKLRETLVAVQQLENNMAKLRKWLATVEHDLSSPVIYQRPDFKEIQKLLHQHQVKRCFVKLYLNIIVQ